MVQAKCDLIHSQRRMHPLGFILIISPLYEHNLQETAGDSISGIVESWAKIFYFIKKGKGFLVFFLIDKVLSSFNSQIN